MNSDVEWNDGRQGVFARIYPALRRFKEESECFHRGVAALQASFTLIAIPENKNVSPCNRNAFPIGLGPETFALPVTMDPLPGPNLIGARQALLQQRLLWKTLVVERIQIRRENRGSTLMDVEQLFFKGMAPAYRLKWLSCMNTAGRLQLLPTRGD